MNDDYVHDLDPFKQLQIQLCFELPQWTTNTMHGGCTHRPIPPFAHAQKEHAQMNNEYVFHLVPFKTATNLALFKPQAVIEEHKSNDEYTHWPMPPICTKTENCTWTMIRWNKDYQCVKPTREHLPPPIYSYIRFFFFWRRTTRYNLRRNLKMTEYFFFSQRNTSLHKDMRTWYRCTHQPGLIYKASDVIHDMQ